MSPLAVVYIRTDNGVRPCRQVKACVHASDRAGARITYWTQGGPQELAAALRLIDRGDAQVLITAHPDMLDHPDVIEAQLGDKLLFAHGDRTSSPQLLLVARMCRAGLDSPMIAKILDITEQQVHLLVRRARRQGLLVLIAVWAWIERPVRAGIAIAAVASLFAPATIPQRLAPPSQRPAPAAQAPRAPGPSPNSQRPTPKRKREQAPDQPETSPPPGTGPSSPAPSPGVPLRPDASTLDTRRDCLQLRPPRVNLGGCRDLLTGRVMWAGGTL